MLYVAITALFRFQVPTSLRRPTVFTPITMPTTTATTITLTSKYLQYTNHWPECSHRGC